MATFSSPMGTKPFLAKDLRPKAFPPALVDQVDFALSRLSERIDSVHYAETGPASRSPSNSDRHKFTLWRGTASSPPVKLPGRFAFREAADLAIMARFSCVLADRLEHGTQRWVELETDHAANPEGFAFQFVGRDEFGWALDRHGCLALTLLQGDELLWFYVRAEVGDEQAPLPPGNELPIDPLPKPNKPSGFKKFALVPKKRC